MYTFKLRRDYSWRWELENPILADGEPGLETNTRRFKVGDGSTRWLDLAYFSPDDPTSPETLAEHVNSALPHPVYDDGPSLSLLYMNAKV
jgi:hypothetical protein